MRKRLVLVLWSGTLAGCHVVPEPEALPVPATLVRDEHAVVDAVGGPVLRTAPPAVLDPVLAQLARGALRAYDTRRRVALENIANVDTPGFKRRFVAAGTHTIAAADGVVFQVPVVRGVEPLFTTGVLQDTGRNLDVAIDGDGFLAVLLADGRTGYTRSGMLQIDRDGKLVTGGNVLSPEITLPRDLLDVAIGPDGMVTGRTAGNPDTNSRFGQLVVHRFLAPGGLRCEDGVFLPSDASGAPVTGVPGTGGLGTLKQGFVERSNVQLQGELLELQMIEREMAALRRVLRDCDLVVP